MATAPSTHAVQAAVAAAWSSGQVTASTSVADARKVVASALGVDAAVLEGAAHKQALLDGVSQAERAGNSVRIVGGGSLYCG